MKNSTTKPRDWSTPKRIHEPVPVSATAVHVGGRQSIEVRIGIGRSHLTHSEARALLDALTVALGEAE